MRVGEPFILNFAPTGVVPTGAMNPHVPLNHTRIVEEVAHGLELGIQMVHLHCRDDDGAHVNDPEPYGRLIEAIRGLPGGREALLCVTTSGRVNPDFAARARVLELDGAMKPDMASLTPGSLNFLRSASVNEPQTIRRLATRMGERGIRPELEVFDLGMAHFVGVLLKEGVLTPPLYVNVLLGNVAGAQTDALHLSAILGALPAGCVVSLAGIGRNQLAGNALGLVLADGVRVGLEDNLWFDSARARQATNDALIRRVLRLANEFERPLMDRGLLRKRLAPTG